MDLKTVLFFYVKVRESQVPTDEAQHIVNIKVTIISNSNNTKEIQIIITLPVFDVRVTGLIPLAFYFLSVYWTSWPDSGSSKIHVQINVL